jgi:Holliday junction resolvase RusA-like endonuclease
MICLRVYGIPKGQPRPKAFARKFGSKWMARVYTPGSAEEFKSNVATAARDLRPASPILGPVRVTTRLLFPRPKNHFGKKGNLKDNAPHHHISKPDCENVLKAILDALTQLGFWHDDSQVCDEHTTKEYSDTPGAVIAIESLAEVVEALNK